MFSVKSFFSKFQNPQSYWIALTSNYGAMLINSIVQLAVIPIYLSTIGVKGFGVLTFTLSLIDFSLIGVMWLGGTGARMMAECAAIEDWKGFSRIYYFFVAIYTGYAVLIGLLFLSIALLFQEWFLLHSHILSRDSFWPTVMSASVLVITQFNFNIEQLALTTIKRHWMGNLLQVIFSLLFFVLVIFCLRFKSAVFLVFFCMSASQLFVCILSWIYWRQGSNLYIKWERPNKNSLSCVYHRIKEMGLHYTVYGMLGKIAQHADILLIGWLGGTQATGLFALLLRIPAFCVQLLWRVATTAETYFVHHDARGERDKLILTYRQGLYIAIAMSLILGLLFSFFGKSVLSLWVGADKIPSSSFAYWIAGMTAFWMGAVRWPASYVYALMDIKRLSTVMFIELFFKCILVIVLFDRFNYLSPFLAVNCEFILGIFILYLWLGATVHEGAGFARRT